MFTAAPACSIDDEDVGEAEGLDGDVALPLDAGVDRDEIVDAVDLEAVTGIVEERHGAIAAGGDLGGEIADGAAHVALVEVGQRGNLEAGGRRGPRRSASRHWQDWRGARSWCSWNCR